MRRFVGLLLEVLLFSSSVTHLQSPFPLNVWCVSARSSRAVDDDLKMGVVVLSPRVKEHLIRNTARLDSWIKTRDEILEIARTQQHINSQPAPMQLGATHKGTGKGKEKGKARATPPPLSAQAETRQTSRAKAKATSLTATEKNVACEAGRP